MDTFPTGRRRAQALGYGDEGHLRGLGKLCFYESLDLLQVCELFAEDAL